jgi:microcystin-dependent protein
MSDQPPLSPDGDPERTRPDRQSAAQRRGQETVILNANNLDEMMSQAKADVAAPTDTAPQAPAAAVAASAPAAAASVAAPAPEAAAPTSEVAAASGRSGLMIGMIAAAVVLLIVVIVLVLVTR